MNTIKEIQSINNEELARGIAGTSASWHSQYNRSAWVYAGNLDHALTEGDIICVLSQFGEIDDIHLIREEETGKSKGFAFVKYQDARSCIIAVDNLVGTEVCGRSLRLDHVEQFKLPKHILEKEDTSVNEVGQAYKGHELENSFTLQKGQDLFDTTSTGKAKEAKLKRKEERQRKRSEREERRKLKHVKKSKKRARGNSHERDAGTRGKKRRKSSSRDSYR